MVHIGISNSTQNLFLCGNLAWPSKTWIICTKGSHCHISADWYPWSILSINPTIDTQPTLAGHLCWHSVNNIDWLLGWELTNICRNITECQLIHVGRLMLSRLPTDCRSRVCQMLSECRYERFWLRCQSRCQSRIEWVTFDGVNLRYRLAFDC